MSTLLLQTKPFMDEILQREVKKLTEKLAKQIAEGFHEIEIEESEISDIGFKIVFYSRAVENLYLTVDKKRDFSKLDIGDNIIHVENTFAIDASGFAQKDEIERLVGSNLCKNHLLSVDLKRPNLKFKIFQLDKYVLALDLVGFPLTKREYKQHMHPNTINPIVINYFLECLQIDENSTFIDPLASLGDVAIETLYNTSNMPLHIRKRKQMTLSSFGLVKMPQIPSKFAKGYAIVQDNKAFKYIKEHLQHSGVKIKVSHYELDWLDVKFKEGKVDYLISFLPNIKDETQRADMLKELFYQAEFVTKKKIGIISRQKIELKYLKENKLKVLFEDNVVVGEQNYYIYVISKLCRDANKK